MEATTHLPQSCIPLSWWTPLLVWNEGVKCYLHCTRKQVWIATPLKKAKQIVARLLSPAYASPMPTSTTVLDSIVKIHTIIECLYLHICCSLTIRCSSSIISTLSGLIPCGKLWTCEQCKKHWIYDSVFPCSRWHLYMPQYFNCAILILLWPKNFACYQLTSYFLYT